MNRLKPLVIHLRGCIAIHDQFSRTASAVALDRSCQMIFTSSLFVSLMGSANCRGIFASNLAEIPFRFAAASRCAQPWLLGRVRYRIPRDLSFHLREQDNCIIITMAIQVFSRPGNTEMMHCTNDKHGIHRAADCGEQCESRVMPGIKWRVCNYSEFINGEVSSRFTCASHSKPRVRLGSFAELLHGRFRRNVGIISSSIRLGSFHSYLGRIHGFSVPCFLPQFGTLCLRAERQILFGTRYNYAEASIKSCFIGNEGMRWHSI